MGTISATTLLLCLVNLDMRYVKCINIQTFYLGIAFSILEQTKDKCCRFNRPASLSI
uniref:60S ribosomal protein L17-2-like isoform X1 n=1 Tax=Rhizophora mucronata TaxID=61149 RepID=A0A2P2JHA1_RHIMU